MGEVIGSLAASEILLVLRLLRRPVRMTEGDEKTTTGTAEESTMQVEVESGIETMVDGVIVSLEYSEILFAVRLLRRPVTE